MTLKFNNVTIANSGLYEAIDLGAVAPRFEADYPMAADLETSIENSCIRASDIAPRMMSFRCTVQGSSIANLDGTVLKNIKDEMYEMATLEYEGRSYTNCVMTSLQVGTYRHARINGSPKIISRCTVTFMKAD